MRSSSPTVLGAVDDEPPLDVSREDAAEATTELLALPWELLHDDAGWLFSRRRYMFDRVDERQPRAVEDG